MAGVKCRYDGQANPDLDIVEWAKNGQALPLCPEQLGGLPTPRTPAEIMGDKVITKNGDDVTDNYNRGAQEALKLALLNNCGEVYLKSKSPMCGHGKIYDGTFSGNLKDGDGIFAQLLKSKNIKVHSVD